MAKRKNPRHGSMQFWPRVRASRPYARVRSVPGKDAKILGFAGYKAGMTHVVATDTSKTSPTKGEKLSIPVTVIECPPMKVASVRFYTAAGYGTAVSKEVFMKASKELARKTNNASKSHDVSELDKVALDAITHITLQVYTQPKLSGVDKKTPEIFELPLGGSVEEQLAFAKEHAQKEITVQDVFTVGQMVDTRAVTKGKGYQGPVKRFGVSLRSHKSEKTIRGPGSLGGWIAQGHSMYRVAFAGQMGYHQRTQYNNQILAIVENPEEVNTRGGFINFGEVKQPCVLVKGSVQGAKKRLVTMTAPLRAHEKKAAPAVDFISQESKQGN
jgi:large subunit ribosomal protein L3